MFSRFLWFVLLWSLPLAWASAQQAEYSRVRIYLDGRSMRDLAALGIEIDHGHYRPKLFIENDFSKREIDLLQQNGFRYEILIEDVVAYYQQQNAVKVISSQTNITCSGIANHPYTTPSHFALGSMGGFPTYQQMLDQLDQMRTLYPNLISVRQVIDPNNLTHEGRPIYWLRISDNPDSDEAEPELLYTALHHSREPLSLAQLLFFMWYVLENYQNDPTVQYLVNNTEMYFVPCLNPDGYIYNETNYPSGGGLWRKNRRVNGTSYGVDLNRNYGQAWGYDNFGSSPDPASDTYRGPSAFSEPETQNLRDFCIEHDFQLAVNYHSHGNMLIYPWAYSDQHTPDSIAYRELAALFTKENKYITGTGTETVGYTSNGDADDWLYGEQILKNKILSMTCETGPSTYGFWPPTSQIESLCKINLGQNLTMAWVMLNCGVTSDRTDPVVSSYTPYIHYSVKRYGFQSGNLTVSIQPVSANILSATGSKTFALNQFEEQQDSFQLFLDTTIGNGESIRYCLILDNGVVQVRDTISKLFGAYSVVFQDPANALTNWTNIGMASFWNTTTTDYYSPPSSLTDSPLGDYANNQTSELILNQTIDLSQASDASLSFWAKWDIEEGYDYVQILAAGDDGVFQPLCGLYTNPGSSDQDENQPLYDGEQNFWVQENMSLNDFLGNSQVVIKIKLASDQWLRADGFYWDDIMVHRLEGAISSDMSLEINKPQLSIGQNQPNPANEQVYIPFQLDDTAPFAASSLQLNIYTVLGQLYHSVSVQPWDSGIHLGVHQWHEGVYFYRVEGVNFQSEVLKMVIQR